MTQPETRQNSRPAAEPVGPPAIPAGTVVPGPSSSGPSKPRPIGGARESDVLALLGALTSSVGVTFLIFVSLAPFDGWVGWLVINYLLFLAFYAVLVSLDESAQAVWDRIAAVVFHTLAAAVLVTLALVVVYVLVRALPALQEPNFYTQDMSLTRPLDPLTSGGMIHGLIGTLIMMSISIVLTVPLGLLCAVFLNEFRGPFPRFVRTITEAMTALPSIVAGLFIYSTAILLFGLDKSGFAAALALGVMMLPIIIRTADVVIRLVPGSLKEASYALGAGQWRTVWEVTLPTARSGLATAVILGTARGIGETSPVLLTAGLTASVNTNPLHAPMVSLPLLAFDLFRQSSGLMKTRGFGAGAVLLVLVLGLFILARTIGGRGPGNLTAGQRRRRERQSREDADRFAQAGRPLIGVLGLDGPGQDPPHPGQQHEAVALPPPDPRSHPPAAAGGRHQGDDARTAAPHADEAPKEES